MRSLSACCGLSYVCHEIVECVLWATSRLSWDCWVRVVDYFTSVMRLLSACCGLPYVCHEIVECMLWATLRLSWDCWERVVGYLTSVMRLLSVLWATLRLSWDCWVCCGLPYVCHEIAECVVGYLTSVMRLLSVLWFATVTFFGPAAIVSFRNNTGLKKWPRQQHQCRSTCFIVLTHSQSETLLNNIESSGRNILRNISSRQYYWRSGGRMRLSDL